MFSVPATIDAPVEISHITTTKKSRHAMEAGGMEVICKKSSVPMTCSAIFREREWSLRSGAQFGPEPHCFSGAKSHMVGDT